MVSGEALLTQLSLLFQQDPLIDEIGLLFGLEPSDLMTDSAFVLENHKLGVAFAAGLALFQAARTQFHPLNDLLRQEAVQMTQIEAQGQRERAQLLYCTRAILLVSADFYTAWNTRKSFVTRGWLDAQDDMQFTNLIFTLHPKSIDTWAHRRWLATRLCSALSLDDLQEFYKQQIEDSSRLADQKARNYHAWSYRHWIVSRLPIVLTAEELERMEYWCRTHVSDHSGWNHRQHTLDQLVNQSQNARDESSSSKTMIFLAEFKFVSDVMASYPTHEALWCHRRYVMQRLLEQTSREEMTDPSSLLVHISQVTGSFLDAELGSPDAATLRSSWDETLKMLSSGRVQCSSIAHAMLCEIDTAWKCQNLFSRRYAAWCLARLRAFLRGRQMVVDKVAHEALTHELSLMVSGLHKRLAHEDSTLEHLWHHLK
uniref:Uncharacterized protein n=1 Tax=Peronospora matthiolae TaxID=2874970 RepID=A0AAV1VDH3_9STRA